MSCSETEREHGPLVVLLVPAVLGGLTLLLARRWSNTNSSSGLHSTAVSRRRRILKDPLARRAPPTPVSQQRMLTARRTTSSPVTPSATTGRKSSIEEESPGAMPPGGRRPTRAPRYSPAPAPPPEPAGARCESAGPPSPKHIPFPSMPQDSELLFEAMTFVFTSVAAGLQFLNLYRTVWWLPHSHNSQAMNFYLMDPHVVAFILTVLSRRLLLSATTALLRSMLTAKVLAHAVLAARMFILGVVLGALSWSTYFILLKHPVVNAFYLCYPAAIYFLFFGTHASPFLELSNGDRPLLHCCYPSANGVRNEVDLLRCDFNLRVKKILFGSFIGAYYTSFIPCCFAQPYLYYDGYAATEHVALVWAALFTRYASHLLSAHYCDVPHRAARHLGGWRLVLNSSATSSPPVPWCARTLWPSGARVATSDGTVYTAQGAINAAHPADSSQRRFYAVFQNPSMLLCLLLCLQLSLILLQLCLLFSSSHWHNFLSLSLLLFSNYYTLFKLVRDYLVMWKVYRAEHMIQEKAPAS